MTGISKLLIPWIYYFNPYSWMNLLGFKNIILKVKLSNKFKEVNKSFVESRSPRKSLKFQDLGFPKSR
jgi:hypothetical protein